MPEIWKDIKNYEGIYEVSSLGNIRSLDRVVEYADGRKQKHKGKILSPGKSTRGYLKIALGRGNQKQIHRLVAEAFIPNPLNLPIVNHKDGNKANNNVSNLEWATDKENRQHASENGLMAHGVKHHASKFTEEDIKWILTHYKKQDKTFGCMALARKFNVAHQTMDEIIKRKNWKHIEI